MEELCSLPEYNILFYSESTKFVSIITEIFLYRSSKCHAFSENNLHSMMNEILYFLLEILITGVWNSGSKSGKTHIKHV